MPENHAEPNIQFPSSVCNHISPSTPTLAITTACAEGTIHPEMNILQHLFILTLVFFLWNIDVDILKKVHAAL